MATTVSAKRGLLAIFSIALVLRLLYVGLTLGLGHTLPVNFREYIVAGQRLLDKGTLVSPFIIEDISNEPSSLMPPVYVAIVAAAYKVFGVETFAATLTLQIINALASSLAALLVIPVARSLGGRRAGWLAGIIVAINPTLIRYTGLIWETNLFAFAIALTMWLAFRLSYRPLRWLDWLLYGLWLGAVAILNPSLTLAYPLLVLWPLTRQTGYSVGDTARGVAVVTLGWALALTPWTVRNYAHFHKLVYVRGGLGMQLWLGVCPEASERRDAIFEAQFPLMGDKPQRLIAEMGENAYIKRCMRQSLTAIREDPGRYLYLSGVRALDYWLGTLYSHRPPGRGGWPGGVFRSAGAVFLTIETLLLLYAVLTFHRLRPELRHLTGVVIIYSLTYCLTHTEVRYRAPCEPVLAVIVSIAGTSVWRALPSRRGSQSRTEAL